MTLSGYEAIEYAQEHNLTLNKYADPIEDAREGLTVHEARNIACEDPNLIWIESPALAPREALLTEFRSLIAAMEQGPDQDARDIAELWAVSVGTPTDITEFPDWKIADWIKEYRKYA